MSLREEPFNFAELLSDVAELVRPQAKAAQVAVNLHLAVLKNEIVIGDPLRIRQVCINIISNAVKYTPAGGSVRIELQQENAGSGGRTNYVFRCADTGIGMSPEFLNKLFLPFEREQDAAGSTISGTGLGMAITKNIIDLMSGEIHVESSPGNGSVFTVIFPLRLSEGKQEKIPAEWRGANCFIVDDDRQNCENVAQLLKDLGLRVQFATEGKTAVRRIAEARGTPEAIRMVLVDWKMPDMDGVETTRQIRRAVGPEIPIVMLTAYDWSELESEAKAAGVTSFLCKPFYRSKFCYLLNALSGEKNLTDDTAFSPKNDYSGRRILLVEDNSVNREIARTILEEMGIAVEEACDGADGVEKVSNSAEGYYDLIFMDVQMPNMDGYAATQAIRKLGRRDADTIPIIAMTANAFDEDVRAALRAGMNAHFAKPIDVKELCNLLSRYLSDVKR